MTDSLRTVGIVTLGAFLSFIIKESGFRGAKLISALMLVLSMRYATLGISKFISFIDSFSLSGEIKTAVVYVLKIVGASYVFGISSDICREIGETGIASAILSIGRIEIILLSLPAISEVFLIAGELL